MSDFTLKVIGILILASSMIFLGGYLTYAINTSTKYVTDAMKK